MRVHLDRKLERMLAILVRLKELRAARGLAIGTLGGMLLWAGIGFCVWRLW